MKFHDFEYVRPEMEPFSEKFNQLLEQFRTASSAEEQLKLFDPINVMRNEFFSMLNICYIRHTVNIKDTFYEEEQNFFDQQTPNFEALNNQFYQLLVDSPYRPELEKQLGKQLFVIAELNLKTFKPIILEDLKKENSLSTAYVKKKASAKILFGNKEYNLSSIQTMETSEDRAIRKAAAEAKWKFFEDAAKEVEEIFDELVKVRTSIAKKLGYKNFIELGYARMLRSDYTPEMVAKFRAQIREHIVPIATVLYERQSKRLALQKLHYFDEEFRFATGNPKPKGSPDWIIAQAEKMYDALSPDTAQFFQHMKLNSLMDLEAKPNKATGGYCTFISKYKSPYIFSNFNGTSGDINVLTHEAGHAFQVYSSRDIELNEYNWPTYEACEIHSMSMELFTMPWMELFFEEDTDKYKFAHLAGAICFLPYGVAVDEFQHFVYENPEATPQERNEAWKVLEQKYLPHKNYPDNLFLENGGYWQRQSHIFSAPFYYIDYTLAQICAFQFWKKDKENHELAWKKYHELCKAGGSKSFLELLEVADLQSPFEEGCVASVVSMIKGHLDQIDDKAF